jgi:protease I
MGSNNFKKGESSMKSLDGLKVAILVANGFEQSEMLEPKKALEYGGAQTFIISPEINKVKAWKHGNWADEFDVDVPLDQANADEYDAIHLPGGVMNPDKLRMIPKAVEFVRAFFETEKPIAAICHGPWTLINAYAVKGKTVTSWLSIKIDLENAGAYWVDKEVVRDGLLVTSRKPDDIPAYNKAIIEMFSECYKKKD